MEVQQTTDDSSFCNWGWTRQFCQVCKISTSYHEDMESIGSSQHGCQHVRGQSLYDCDMHKPKELKNQACRPEDQMASRSLAKRRNQDTCTSGCAAGRNTNCLSASLCFYTFMECVCVYSHTRHKRTPTTHEQTHAPRQKYDLIRYNRRFAEIALRSAVGGEQQEI